MTFSESNNTPRPGLFRDLLNRRVPQIVGFYLGGSWGILQFFDWIVDRYLLSPQLVDLGLTILGSLLPSVIVLAYCHGSPGKNRWHRSEKMIIPVNLVLTVALVFLMFSHKNLDSIARRVAVTDESGNRIEKVVPKRGSIKELAVFYFENVSGEKKLDWLQYGLVNMLQVDLAQDPFINTHSPSTYSALEGFYIYRKFKDAGHGETAKAPLMLQKKIAGELNSPHFLSGTIDKAGDMVELTAVVYLTKDTQTVSKKVFKGKSVFSLVDKLTGFVKRTLKLPSYKNDEIVDLPIKDMYTHSEKAARLAALASNEIMKNNDWKAGQKYLEAAVREDKTFTLAYRELAEIYAYNNNMEQWKATYKTLMKYLYKLPEKMQFYLKASYYVAIKGEPEKAISILKMMTQLYPSDIKNYLALASHLAINGDYGEAVTYYQEVLRLDPGRFDLYQEIGKAYENKSDFENALVYFKKYAEKFPRQPEGFLQVGKTEERLGNFEEAGKYYEKALLLEPENASTARSLAGLDIKCGRYRDALDKYSEALASAKNSRQKFFIYSDLVDYYELRGRPAKELEYTELMLESGREFMAPLTVIIARVLTLEVYIKNGKQDQVKRMLDSIKEKLSSPFDKLVSLGYVLYYIDRGELDKAESLVGDLEAFVEQAGGKQFLFFYHKNRGDILRLKKMYDEALVQYKKALEMSKSKLAVLNLLASCCREQEKYDESLGYVQRALNISPFDPETNYSASLLYFTAGKGELGLKHLKTALAGWEDADPGFMPAKEAKKLLIQHGAGGEDGE